MLFSEDTENKCCFHRDIPVLSTEFPPLRPCPPFPPPRRCPRCRCSVPSHHAIRAAARFVPARRPNRRAVVRAILRTAARSPRLLGPPASPSLGIGAAARAVRPGYRTLALPRPFVDPRTWLGRRLPQRPHARLRDAAGVEPFIRAALIEGGSK